MSKRAFTLVELLVVVAIIALLVSVLLPSLGRAKDAARRAICGSNIRQLHMANTGYASENDGKYALAAEDIFGANLERWHGRRDDVESSFDPLRSPLRNYLGDGKVKSCPSYRNFFPEPGQAGAGFEAGCGGYGYNDTYVGGRYDKYGFDGYSHSARDSDAACAGETVMFTDTAFMQSAGLMIEYSFCKTPYWQFEAGGPPSTSRPNPTIHFRHLDTTSVAWVDGHVSWEKMSFTDRYQTHSMISVKEAEKAGLGWFGPDSNELFDLK